MAETMAELNKDSVKVYSSTKRPIGYDENGKTIYTKTIQFQGPASAGGSVNIPLGETIETIRNIYGGVSNNGNITPLNRYYPPSEYTSTWARTKYHSSLPNTIGHQNTYGGSLNVEVTLEFTID